MTLVIKKMFISLQKNLINKRFASKPIGSLVVIIFDSSKSYRLPNYLIGLPEDQTFVNLILEDHRSSYISIFHECFLF